MLRGASTGELRRPVTNLRKAGNWFIAEAVVFLVLGIFAIVEPAIAGVAVTSLIGWLLTLGGVAHLSIMLTGVGAARVVWQMIHGIIYAISGIYFLIHPLIGRGTLALLLSAILLAEGLLKFIAYFRTRDNVGSVWLLTNGIITLLLGGLISIRWPSDSGWAISTLVGANLFMTGFSRLIVTVKARNASLT